MSAIPEVTEGDLEDYERTSKQARVDQPTSTVSIPPKLLEHAAKALASSLQAAADRGWLADAGSGNLHQAATRVVDALRDMVVEGAAHSPASSAREVNVALRSQCDVVSRGIRKTQEIARSVAAGDEPVDGVLQRCRILLAQLDRNSNVIRGHHQHLRRACSTLEGVDAASAVWADAMLDQSALEQYASAAQATGDATWVKNGMQWGLDQVREFFHEGGGEKASLRELRAEFYSSAGTNAELTAELAEQMRGKARASMLATQSRPLRLLDVGSCYNPFKNLEGFEVSALDLCPRDSTVYRSDFLALEVGSEGAQWEVDESARSDTCAGDLKQLPRNEFDVLVFSLVLSYLPHPLLRTRMMAKARDLLREPGLLVLMTPHSSDSSSAREPYKQLKEWRRALEELGFRQYRHTKLHSVHGLAFRTVAAPATPTLLPMPIAYDDQRGIVLRESPVAVPAILKHVNSSAED